MKDKECILCKSKSFLAFVDFIISGIFLGGGIGLLLCEKIDWSILVGCIIIGIGPAVLLIGFINLKIFFDDKSYQKRLDLYKTRKDNKENADNRHVISG